MDGRPLTGRWGPDCEGLQDVRLVGFGRERVKLFSARRVPGFGHVRDISAVVSVDFVVSRETGPLWIFRGGLRRMQKV